MPDAGNNVARIEMHNLTDKTYIFFFYFGQGNGGPQFGRQLNLLEVKVCLVYKVNSRTVRAAEKL